MVMHFCKVVLGGVGGWEGAVCVVMIGVKRGWGGVVVIDNEYFLKFNENCN